jgi:hypothetical protein
MDKRISQLLEQLLKYEVTPAESAAIAQALALASIAESLEKLSYIANDFGQLIRIDRDGFPVSFIVEVKQP